MSADLVMLLHTGLEVVAGGVVLESYRGQQKNAVVSSELT